MESTTADLRATEQNLKGVLVEHRSTQLVLEEMRLELSDKDELLEALQKDLEKFEKANLQVFPGGVLPLSLCTRLLAPEQCPSKSVIGLGTVGAAADMPLVNSLSLRREPFELRYRPDYSSKDWQFTSACAYRHRGAAAS